MTQVTQLDVVTKIVKDFFSVIIHQKIELTTRAMFYDYETALLKKEGAVDKIIVKSMRLPNYRYGYRVYIPDPDTAPQWAEVEVRDEAVIYSDNTGESASTWQIEKLRYSEALAIKRQLDLCKDVKISLSDTENFYILGSPKRLEGVAPRITLGLPTTPSD